MANIAKLEQPHYKGLILGTGMYESLLSAALAYKGFPSLNLDQESSYSAAIRTCSVKEFVELFTNVYPKNTNHIFKIINYENNITEEEKGKLRGFNIDLQPRFLYSSSLTVNKMVEAGMDKYMDFRAISGVFFYDTSSSKFLKVPINKGEIFSSPALSLIEKRKLFKFLHACMALFKVLTDSESDINSTAEFEKELKVDEDLVKKVLEIRKEHVSQFMEVMGVSGKLADMLVYVIANCVYTIEDTKDKEYFLSTEDFIIRVEKFLKSMGIHSNYPYLYTNYGTSDIPQGFSRASAVNGSIFILHPSMSLEGITRVDEQTETQQKINFKLKTDLVEGKEHASAELLVLNKDYVDLLEGFEEKDLSVEEKALLRITVIVEDVTKDITVDTPSFYYLFPGTKELENQSPVFIFATGEKSNSSPANFYIFYVQTVINAKETEENKKKLEKSLREFIREHLCEKSEYRELTSAAYVQERRRYAKEEEVMAKGGVIVLDDDDYSLDLDGYFGKGAEYMKRLCPESEKLLFYANAEKKEGEAQKMEDDEDNEGDSHLKGLLESLDKFKVDNSNVNVQENVVEKVEESGKEEKVEEVVEGKQDVEEKEKEVVAE